MNERIFELAEQAENYATTRHSVSNIALSVNSEKFVKRFAELIVRECCQFEKSYGGDAGLVARSFSRKIKQHFGVE